MLRSLVGSEMCIRDRVSTQSTGTTILVMEEVADSHADMRLEQPVTSPVTEPDRLEQEWEALVDFYEQQQHQHQSEDHDEDEQQRDGIEERIDRQRAALAEQQQFSPPPMSKQQFDEWRETKKRVPVDQVSQCHDPVSLFIDRPGCVDVCHDQLEKDWEQLVQSFEEEQEPVAMAHQMAPSGQAVGGFFSDVVLSRRSPLDVWPEIHGVGLEPATTQSMFSQDRACPGPRARLLSLEPPVMTEENRARARVWKRSLPKGATHVVPLLAQRDIA
eukprot:TRINITY_DN46174_c0_g1_i2.p1 TRINITY_DN46174_c0_g1~~TRINITY_DN46174_c0_g1_i2.p1  ORF type:complete len:273 (+),score=76.00 TRINITY_DN46174_c0_g1_i2:124-942(+)